MIYSLLIHEAPGYADARSQDERERALQIHRTFQADLKRDGAFVSATQLAESGGNAVRNNVGKVMVTDAPLPETKELFIGLYLVRCDSLDQALAYAKRIPVSTGGRVDVRPAVWVECEAFVTSDA